jgi:hypothetical protein
MVHKIQCDDCGKPTKDIELNTKRGSNKLICDECVKKREKGND